MNMLSSTLMIVGLLRLNTGYEVVSARVLKYVC